MRLFKSLILITLSVFVFDLLINLILPNNIKKKIGTTRNYSLKSTNFHHIIAPEINVNEFWGKKKYRVKTNELSMRINQNENFKINRNNKYVGFIGDSFVYGSGINYEDHFISKLKIKNKKFLNLGYVSYSPSIYFKRLEQLVKKEKIKFETIFLFVDHSDIQDEGQFYREDFSGNIVRKWIDDDEVKFKNRKYKIKNYFKQNSFIFKFYENISAANISNKTKKCLIKEMSIDYKNYLDINRFGFSYINNNKNKDWVEMGINKTLFYLDKIKILSDKYNFKLVVVFYPSALEVIDNIKPINSKHFVLLRDWSLKNKISFVNTSNDFMDENYTKDYLNNFIRCDVHWNENGHKVILNNIKKFINE